VKVAVRVRPLSNREIMCNSDVCVSMSGPITVVNTQPPKTFAFDQCYWSTEPGSSSHASQEDVCEEIGSSLLDNSLDGFNSCLFAYGQTGSGKSYSIHGTKTNPGILTWIVHRLFMERNRLEDDRQKEQKEIRVWISYLEIYNENLRDLLCHGLEDQQELKIRDSPKLGVYVSGMKEVPCESIEQVQKAIDYGQKKRIVAATQMNSCSSRSHTVFTLKVHLLTGSVPRPGEPDRRKVLLARLNLIDLAGSERQAKAQAEGQTLKEGCSINKSLSALGLVIKELCDRSAQEKSKRSFSGSLLKPTSPKSPSANLPTPTSVPFRASKLTFLLKDSLAGNSKTCMMATISPARENMEETLSTLRFAASVKQIKTQAIRNMHTKDELIHNLRKQLEELRQQLSDGGQDIDISSDQVREQERLLEEMFKDRKVLLEQAAQAEEAREQVLREMSLTQDGINSVFGVDKGTPYLLNMSDDPSLAGCLLYYIVAGKAQTIGAAKDNTIRLSGIGIPDHLCVVENSGEGVVHICKCGSEGRIMVDGRLLEPGVAQQLRHGQRVLLGRAFALKAVVPSLRDGAGSPAPSIGIGLDLDDEELCNWSVVEDTPAWARLQNNLQQVVSTMTTDAARVLYERSVNAVKACEEANELTQECRKDSGFHFEPSVTADGSSVVIKVLHVSPGEPLEKGTEVYVWSYGQLMGRLERMRDAYHELVQHGKTETSTLQDPWREVESDDVKQRLRDLQFHIDDLAEECGKLRHAKERAMGRVVALWRSDMWTNVRLYFDGWRQMMKVSRRRQWQRRMSRNSVSHPTLPGTAASARGNNPIQSRTASWKPTTPPATYRTGATASTGRRASRLTGRENFAPSSSSAAKFRCGTEAEERAIVFDLRMIDFNLEGFSLGKQREFCAHVKGNLGCDHVEITGAPSVVDAVISVQAVGFVHEEHASEAAQLVQSGEAVHEHVWGRHSVPWPVEHTKCMHCPSALLRSLRRMYRDGRGALSSVQGLDQEKTMVENSVMTRTASTSVPTSRPESRQPSRPPSPRPGGPPVSTPHHSFVDLHSACQGVPEEASVQVALTEFQKELAAHRAETRRLTDDRVHLRHFIDRVENLLCHISRPQQEAHPQFSIAITPCSARRQVRQPSKNTSSMVQPQSSPRQIYVAPPVKAVPPIVQQSSMSMSPSPAQRGIWQVASQPVWAHKGSRQSAPARVNSLPVNLMQAINLADDCQKHKLTDSQVSLAAMANARVASLRNTPRQSPRGEHRPISDPGGTPKPCASLSSSMRTCREMHRQVQEVASAPMTGHMVGMRVLPPVRCDGVGSPRGSPVSFNRSLRPSPRRSPAPAHPVLCTMQL